MKPYSYFLLLTGLVFVRPAQGMTVDFYLHNLLSVCKSEEVARQITGKIPAINRNDFFALAGAVHTAIQQKRDPLQAADEFLSSQKKNTEKTDTYKTKRMHVTPAAKIVTASS